MGKYLGSGSVSFFLKMFNTPHIETTPNRFTINVHPLSGALFEEGNGLDLETYKDKGAVNWISASQNVLWVNTRFGLL